MVVEDVAGFVTITDVVVGVKWKEGGEGVAVVMVVK